MSQLLPTTKTVVSSNGFSSQRKLVYNQLQELLKTHTRKLNTWSLEEFAKAIYTELDTIDVLDTSNLLKHMLIKGTLSILHIVIIPHICAENARDVNTGVICIDDGNWPILHASYVLKYAKYLEKMFTIIFGKHHPFNIQDIISIEHWLQSCYVPGYTSVKDMRMMSAVTVKKEFGIDLYDILEASHASPICICNPRGLLKISSALKLNNPLRHKLNAYFAYKMMIAYSTCNFKVYHTIYTFAKQSDTTPMPPSIYLSYNIDLHSSVLDMYYYNEYTNHQAISFCTMLCNEYVCVYSEAIRTNPWLSNKTKDMFVRKLHRVRFNIGKKPPTFINVDNSTDAFQYLSKVYKKQYTRLKTEVGKPVISNITSYDVNSSNNIITNTICIPTALLMPPILDMTKPLVYNLSKIGFIIGHELSHCFDEHGILYDDEGIYHSNPIMSKDDVSKYKKRMKQMYTKMHTQTVSDGIGPFGMHHMDEVIADITGILLTEKILYKYVPSDGIISALNYFYNQYSSLWNKTSVVMSIYPDDFHLPDKYRVKYVLSASHTFQSIYKLPTMYPTLFV
jgi:hypothetical protein